MPANLVEYGTLQASRVEGRCLGRAALGIMSAYMGARVPRSSALKRKFKGSTTSERIPTLQMVWKPTQWDRRYHDLAAFWPRHSLARSSPQVTSPQPGGLRAPAGLHLRCSFCASMLVLGRGSTACFRTRKGTRSLIDAKGVSTEAPVTPCSPVHNLRSKAGTGSCTIPHLNPPTFKW